MLAAAAPRRPEQRHEQVGLPFRPYGEIRVRCPQPGRRCSMPGTGLQGSAAMACALLLVLLVGLAILIPAFAHLRPVLVDTQPALQLLGATLLLWRRVPFALLFAQRIKFLLQG